MAGVQGDVQTVGAGSVDEGGEAVEGGDGGGFVVAVAQDADQPAVWYVGDGQTDSLRAWQQRMLWLIGINLVIAGSYTLFPKRER